jgi:hypothetical protein
MGTACLSGTPDFTSGIVGAEISHKLHMQVLLECFYLKFTMGKLKSSLLSFPSVTLKPGFDR